jgi:hypothetical protein
MEPKSEKSAPLGPPPSFEAWNASKTTAETSGQTPIAAPPPPPVSRILQEPSQKIANNAS